MGHGIRPSSYVGKNFESLAITYNIPRTLTGPKGQGHERDMRLNTQLPNQRKDTTKVFPSRMRTVKF